MLLISVFGATSVQFLPSMNRLTQALSQISYNQVSLDKIYCELKENKSEVLNSMNLSANNLISYNKEIELKDITYSYGAKKVLNKVNIKVPKGKKIALVGPSGSGKTTLIDIILGILEPLEGQITVDGKKITNNNLKSWQEYFGYIPQIIYLYDRSLRENIAFGLKKEEINEQRVWESIEQASLREFVEEECTNGLDTIVGENGIRLSGGQRQRIGIARALYLQPKILILDEATAALDNQTEKEIIQSLKKLADDVTIIAIAHRLSTIKNYDVIYMLENGKITGAGNYHNLQINSDSFKKMADIVNT